MSHRFRNSIIITSGVIVMSFLVFGGGLYWVKSDLEAQAEKIVNAKMTATRRSRALEALAELKRVAPQAEVYQAEMDKLLPTEDELIGFGGWLQNLGRVRQVSVDFSFEEGGAETQNTFPGFIPFSLRLTGGYENILRFLEDIEINSAQYLISLGTIEISGSGASYKVSTVGRIFFD